MRIVAAGELGDERWDAVCATAAGSWFWHTSAWRDYTLAYRPGLSSQTLAFAVCDGDDPLALLPLMVEDADDAMGPVLSFGGDPCWSPALAVAPSDPRGAAAMRRALEHVDVIGRERGVRAVALRVSPLAMDVDAYLSVFMAETTRAGYGDVSLTSQVINLVQPIDAVTRGMRKGHRADITRGRRSLDTVVVSGPGSMDDFARYRAMHALAAGRVTRPAATFDLMRSWLCHGQAVLVKAILDGDAVGFSYLLLFAGSAYYASAANRPDLGTMPIGHVLQAAAIEWLKETGVERYELGVQQFGPLPHDVPTAKQLAIAGFKRGFGGSTRPLVIREKWFSATAAHREWSGRLERFAAATRAAEGTMIPADTPAEPEAARP